MKRYAISQGVFINQWVPLIDVDKIRRAIEETIIESNPPSYAAVNVEVAVQEWYTSSM